MILRRKLAGPPRAVERHPLALLMLLAAALRLWAATTPGFHHPDAIYQYLEPAHRLLTGEGVVTWEWRTGIRSWLLPTVLAVPLGIGEAIDPNGPLPMLLPRLATATASLGIVWAAWDIGERHGKATALLAGFVAATWFEIVFFAAETLAEPVATTAFLPAAALVTRANKTPQAMILAGALLGFAALVRPHYGPAVAALVLVSWRYELFDMKRWLLLLSGAAGVALVSALIDGRQGLTPFAWIVGNFHQNIVDNVSAQYGTLPALSYVAWFMRTWNWWLVPAVVGILFGWRQCPGLLAAAAVTLLLHSLIPHKEYRFIFLPITALTVIAALGWGEILAMARARYDRGGAAAMAIGVVLMWSAASIWLAHAPTAPNRLNGGTVGWNTFAHLRSDQAVCGVALVYPASFAAVPGVVALRRGVPVSMYWNRDPALHGTSPWVGSRLWDGTFNRIVTASNGAIRVPPGFAVEHCEAGPDDRMCILARAGSCDRAGRSPFAINQAMARLGL